MRLREVLARNLRRLRQSHGFSQEAVAAEAEISREYLSKLEKGDVYSASVDVIERLARALRVEPHVLLMRTQRADRT